MRFRTCLATMIALLAVAPLASLSVASADAPPLVEVGASMRPAGGGVELVIEGAFDVPSYAVRARDGGRTVVIDVTGATVGSGGVRGDGASSLISRTTSSTTARGARVEVTLARDAAYHATAEPGRIVVRFEALEDEAANANAAEVASAAADRSGPVTVRRVHIESRDGRERVVVELSRPAEFRVIPGMTGPARLEIEGARVADGASESVVGRRAAEQGEEPVVRSVQARAQGARAVVEVDRREGAPTTAIREGNRIVWMFAPPPAARDQRPRGRTIAREDLGEDEGVDTVEVAGFLSDLPLQVDAARGRQRYSGRRIDLDFKDADIQNMLRLLSEVGGVNIVSGDDVTGAVTIRMRNVPWDQALDVILQAKGLGMVRRGNLIRVAPLTTLEKERELAIARRKQNVELAPIETRLMPVSYATAEELQPRVRELLTSRGSVSYDRRTNVLIVRDVVDSLDDAEELVRSLDTQTPQVLVEARIVEATSQYLRDVGIQWGGDVSMTSATGNPTGLLFPSNASLSGGAYDSDTPTAGLSPFTQRVAVPNFAVNLPAAVGTGAGGAIGLSLGSVDGNFNLNVRLSAAEASGVLRIVSSPRILTLDNNEAHISQGTLIPYSQVSAQGVQTAFQQAKLELRVTPHVTSDGAVSMRVFVTRDEPDFTRVSARGDPTILKREAETNLLVQDGHTAVIGGIYTRTAGRNVNQVPVLGDIPIIGVLFQHRSMRDERNELLIFLTPRIVNRAEALTR